MPTRRRVIDLDEVATYIRRRCFSPSRTDRVGAEIEWITVPASDPSGYPDPADLEAIAAGVPLPGGSKVTMEPGGQVELSSSPHDDLGALLGALTDDAAALEEVVHNHGLTLLGVGMHPDRRCRRVLETPRYRAMDTYYERIGPAGARMMCNTAAIQINLDLGSAEQTSARWRLAHSLGPILGAIFADSPVSDGRPTGWRSTRMANWWDVDPSRTSPVGSDGDPVELWARYVLEAEVMMVADGTGRVPLTEPLRFSEWMSDGHPLGYPDWSDLDLHLTTLFPPVRPRGWLELRMIDALPGSLWRAAVAVTAALFYDQAASAAAADLTGAFTHRWSDASRFGAQHPDFRDAGEACLDLASNALARMDVPRSVREEVLHYKERYTSCGLTPADETLNRYLGGRITSSEDPQREAAWS